LLARHLAGNFGKNLIGVDLAELAAAAADLLGQTPLTRVELGARLGLADRDAIVAEGERLLGFAAPAIAVRDVRFVPVRSG
jgi:hypothetical protein